MLLVKYELKKYFNKSLIIFISLLVITTYLDNFLHYQLGAEKPNIVAGNFGLSLLITQFYLIFLASVYITSEFQLGTSKSVFTGVYTRIEIINIKTIAIILISLCLGILNWIIGLLLEIILLDSISITSALFDLLIIASLYLIYILSVLTFSLLISSICLNRLVTIIINFGAFIFIGDITVQIANRSPKLAKIVENLPFYIVTNGFNNLRINIDSLILIIIFIAAFYLSGIVIFKKRDLT
ncbi:ABC-2 family transporter protein [Terribacillus saccharophilus]|uniref:ABC-2 family transporter protein n=1 Tax=Terribacillus saccharophilus TaxID=361277 RepID=A0AAX2EJM5_9BACI|nr:ABC-2 family transporter protein [Terribacillus saccharophilus]